jgi:hypothetical protein
MLGNMMNTKIAKELQILWSDFDENDVDAKMEAFERLKRASKKKDLTQLVVALKSEKNDFWTRELISEPISELGGCEYLSELFDALGKNYDDGHDNDTLNHLLTEIAEAEPELCKQKLKELLSEGDYQHRETAEWLFEFCKQE